MHDAARAVRGGDAQATEQTRDDIVGVAFYLRAQDQEIVRRQRLAQTLVGDQQTARDGGGAAAQAAAERHVVLRTHHKLDWARPNSIEDGARGAGNQVVRLSARAW